MQIAVVKNYEQKKNIATSGKLIKEVYVCVRLAGPNGHAV
jgi:hypothetical protein